MVETTSALSSPLHSDEQFLVELGGALFSRFKPRRGSAGQLRKRAGTQGRDFRIFGRTQLGAQALRLESQGGGDPGEDQASPRALGWNN